jgi:phosphoserine phosphatase
VTEAPRYRTVVVDVDSTLCGIEGIDWLADRRGAEVAAAVAAMTDRAMRGEIALDAVYGERLALVRPGRADLAALADAYAAAVAPGAAAALDRLRAAGVRVSLVSGGLRQAILPAVRPLGFAYDDVHAVDVVLDMGGGYFAFDAGSPLATQGGKADVARTLLADGRRERPALAVGDGSTDVALRGPGACDALAAFVGFARRESVVAAADHVVASFDALVDLVLDDGVAVRAPEGDPEGDVR